MAEELLSHHTARVRDVKVPSGADENLIKLLEEVISLLEEERANPKGGSIKMFEVIFKLLAKLGVHGTVFQTGSLIDTENDEEGEKPFIFSGSYALKKGETVLYHGLPVSGKKVFQAVVIGEKGKIPKLE